MENEDGHAVNYTTSLCNWLLSNSVKRVKSSNGDAGMSSANGSAVSTASAASLADADAAPPPPPPLPPGWVVLPQALLEQQAPQLMDAALHTLPPGCSPPYRPPCSCELAALLDAGWL